MIECRTIPIYEVDVYFLTDREEAREFIRGRSSDEADAATVDDCKGLSYTLNDAGGLAHRMLCVFDHTPAVAVHESVHMAWIILKHCGVKVSQGNDEPLAYLAAWLASEVLRLVCPAPQAP